MWAPRKYDTASETFSGKHVLRLGSDGFTFHQQKATQPLKFFLLSRSVVWQDQVLLSLSDRPDVTEKTWLVNAAASSNRVSHANSKNGWCILFEDESSHPRAARFVISHITGNKVFLHFACPLRLSSIDNDSPGTAEQLPGYMCIARPADSQQEFIIAKSSTPQSDACLAQNSTRIDSMWLFFSLRYVERCFVEWFLGDMREKSTLLLIAWGVFAFMPYRWVDRVLHTLVHRAWIEIHLLANMASKRTVEVFLETVELRTTDSIYDDDEVLLSICLLPVAVRGVLLGNAASELVLVRSFSDSGAGKYVCCCFGVESCILGLFYEIEEGSLICLEARAS